MSDTTNGWPGEPGVPMNPEKDGWHWVNGMPREWVVFDDGGSWRFAGSDYRPHEWAHRIYRGPCLTPDEATALQKRADQSALGYAREARRADLAKFLHKRDVAALQARVAELEAALRDIASGRYSNVLLPTHPPQDPAVVRARGALEGGKKDE